MLGPGEGASRGRDTEERVREEAKQAARWSVFGVLFRSQQQRHRRSHDAEETKAEAMPTIAPRSPSSRKKGRELNIYAWPCYVLLL